MPAAYLKRSATGSLIRLYGLLKNDSRYSTGHPRRTNFILGVRTRSGGGDRVRTDDPLLAKQVLSQLSYTPTGLVGLVGFEPTTPALSRRCSNRLSYRPSALDREGPKIWSRSEARERPCRQQQPISVGAIRRMHFSRKEVIQPHLPIRLPCYDFTPVTNPAVVIALLAVRLTTSGRTRSHGVTGGVYKTRERIHRDMLIRDY